MKLKKLFCLLSFAGASFSALAGENVIHISSGSYTIAGTLTLPDNVKNPPAVLILHGFTGEKDGQKTPFFPERLPQVCFSEMRGGRYCQPQNRLHG